MAVKDSATHSLALLRLPQIKERYEKVASHIHRYHSKKPILSITSKKLKACANLFLQSDEPRDEGETFDPDVTAQGLRGGQLQTELDEGQEVWRDHTHITLDQLIKKFHGFACLFLQDNQKVGSN